MKLAIRGHDLGAKGSFNLPDMLCKYDIDAVQLICYKTFEGIEYCKNQITKEKAGNISKSLKEKNKFISLLGAYFNPVHSDKNKVENGVAVFKEYLKFACDFECDIVGSETGSYNDDKWTYNSENRTEKALKTVCEAFYNLCGYGENYKASVGIEGAAGHVCYDIKQLARAYKNIGCKNLKIIFDLYNFLDEENYTSYLDILKQGLDTFDNIHCFHIKDFYIENGKPKQCSIGKGIADFNEIIKNIYNYDKNAILTLEGVTGESIRSSAQCIKDKWRKLNEI
jgi:sugar phosphate isomerase/epimerase